MTVAPPPTEPSNDVVEFARALRERIDGAGQAIVGDRSVRVNLRLVDDRGMEQLQAVWAELMGDLGGRMVTRMVDTYRQLTAEGRRREDVRRRVLDWIDGQNDRGLNLLDDLLEMWPSPSDGNGQ